MLKRLEPFSARLQVMTLWPAHPSEFHCQAVLYAELLKRGVRVKGEVTWTKTNSNNPKDRNCRFDLVVFDEDGRGVEIIEVKGGSVADPYTEEQEHKYRHFGAQVTLVYGMDGVHQYLRELDGVDNQKQERADDADIRGLLGRLLTPRGEEGCAEGVESLESAGS